MQTAIRAYEAHLNEAKQINPGSNEYFNDTAKPVFMQITEEGIWPPNCSFFGFYRLNTTVGGKPIKYDGFWLRLTMGTPKGKFGAFALPIIDLASGKVEF